ncbi:MAG: dienelactone hydrolase family protein, partial [Acidobacteriaceae bacterium]|nr:dienelactone hydrolase family protein [Acidobacteriaceae bacterium]
MTSQLPVGFAVATMPIAAGTITTDAIGVDAREVTVQSAQFEMPAYQARPVGTGRFPVVLVVQEVFGVHEHIKDICRRLAKEGYLAIAPELYARQG